MPGLSTLQDDFNDGTLDTGLWSGSYGDPEEAGGRARIPCTTGYAGLKSGSSYTLTSNGIFLRVIAPTPGGATSSVASILVLTSTGGTDAGFIVDSAANAVGLYLRDGFADPGAVFLTYSATDHAWMRFREDAGTLYWDTSPDGSTWTNRRTATTPAWAADSNLAFLVEAHRDAGAADYVEIDNVNVPPGQTIPLGLAAETDTAQNLAAAKTLALGTAGESDSAQPVQAAKHLVLGPASEASTTRALTATKTLTLTPAGQTASTQTVSRLKAVALGLVIESDTSRVLTKTKTKALALASETDTAVTITHGTPLPDDITITVGEPYSRWKVDAPWI